METCYLSLLSLLVCAVCQGVAEKRDKQICVVTDKNSTNPSCHTLRYYMRNSSFFFTSNSTFLFEPGEHLTNFNSSLVIQNVSGLVLRGQNATIQCNKYQNYFKFNNVSELSIHGLKFCECGQKSTNWTIGYSTLMVSNSTNLNISEVTISKSEYQGILVSNVLGLTSIVNSCIVESRTNRYKKLDKYPANAIYYSNCGNNNSSLIVLDTVLEKNENLSPSKHNRIHQAIEYPFAAGLTVVIKCSNVAVSLDNITADGNIGGDGGNLAIVFHTPELFRSHHVVINNSHISNGTAIEGGGLFVSIVEPRAQRNNSQILENNHTILSIINTEFTNNTALYLGGAVGIRQKGSNTSNFTGNVRITNCKFTGNSLKEKGHGGIAINYLNFIVTQVDQHISPQFRAFVTNCTFRWNHVQKNSRMSAGSSVIFVKTNPYFRLQDVVIDSNFASAILGLQSNIVLGGNVTLTNNSAQSGGGILLCQNAVLYLEDGVNVLISGNNANHAGGGIAVESICLESEPICFFQFVSPEPRQYTDIKIYVHDNQAHHAGDNLYGGSVEYCYLIESSTHGLLANHSLPVFQEIFEIYPEGAGLPYVTSPPDHVCICIDNVPDCNRTEYIFPEPVYPGQPFNLTVILAGQLDGSIPGIISANLENFNRKKVSLLRDYQVQKLNSSNCTTVKYEIYSSETETNVTLRLVAAQQGDISVTEYLRQYRELKVKVLISKCPKGFNLSEGENGFTCSCEKLFTQAKIHCYIKHQTLEVPRNTWIGYFNDSSTFVPQETYVVVNYCPQEFCKQKTMNITTTLIDFDQRDQCQENRQGIMCGECSENYSVNLGGSHCKRCSNHWLWTILLYGLSGIFLVFLLMLVDVTVADGTINGLIFYANIIQANYEDIFTSQVSKYSFTKPLKVFVGWLSFANGVEKCFFNGMTEYHKAWIQFAFPAYIWIIMGAIILLSRRYAIVVRIIGKNTVKVFATLILLSYSKLILAIIDGIDSTLIDASNNKQYRVWSKNGNIQFLHGIHIPLFVFCVCLLIVCVPFTLSLLFIQILERYSHLRIFWFVRKLKPLFDAYTGPYVDNARFWTGFLLLIRIGIFFAAKRRGKLHDDANLTITIALLFVVLCTSFLLRNGIYKRGMVQILEASLLLNLSFVFIVSEYLHVHQKKKAVIIPILIGIAFATFFLVVIYHILKKIYSISCVQICLGTLKERVTRQWPYERLIGSQKNSSATTFTPTINEFTEDREPLLAKANK